MCLRLLKHCLWLEHGIENKLALEIKMITFISRKIHNLWGEVGLGATSLREVNTERKKKYVWGNKYATDILDM